MNFVRSNPNWFSKIRTSYHWFSSLAWFWSAKSWAIQLMHLEHVLKPQVMGTTSRLFSFFRISKVDETFRIEPDTKNYMFNFSTSIYCHHVIFKNWNGTPFPITNGISVSQRTSESPVMHFKIIESQEPVRARSDFLLKKSISDSNKDHVPH